MNEERIKLLLVEDEESLATGLVYNFTEEGYTVDWVKDGKEALEKFEKGNYDVIVLDIMLPYLNGYEVAGKIRDIDPKMPILMLTARTSEKDVIKGLETGADDYITKPFNLDELLLRIKGMLKRKAWYKDVTEKNPRFKFGGFEVDFENMTYTNENKSYQLTQKEAMVLKYLVGHIGKIVSREELLKNVWEINPEIETRTVDIFISRLRKHFEKDPSQPRFIKSVRGAGYIFGGE
jgi:DNA-binding response OmpR family regulator